MPYGRSRLTASSQVGDPFLGGLIKGGLKLGGRLLGGTPIGAAAGTIGGIILGKKGRVPMVPIQQSRPGVGREPQRVPGARGTIQRILPGGASGFECPPKKKRRRMNPTNIKALRRAVRREEAFIRAAKKTGLVTVPKAKRVRRAARPRRRS